MDDEKYYYRNPFQKVKGPIPFNILKERKAFGEVSLLTQVRKKGESRWISYAKLERLLLPHQSEESKELRSEGSGPATGNDIDLKIGIFVVLGVIAILFAAFFPVLFGVYAVGGIGLGLICGYNMIQSGKVFVGISIVIVTLCIALPAGYFTIVEIMKPSEPIDWEQEEKAEEWLSHPANREIFNKYMREEKDR